MKDRKFIALVFGVFVLSFVVAGQIMADPVKDAGAVVTSVDPVTSAETSAWANDSFEAIINARWVVLAGLALIGVTFVVRALGKKYFPWLATKRGGAVLVLFLAFLGETGHALISGDFAGKLDLKGLLAVVAVAWTASGGWSNLGNLFFPKEE